jgi:hypothetical protein
MDYTATHTDVRDYVKRGSKKLGTYCVQMLVLHGLDVVTVYIVLPVVFCSTVIK